MFRKDPGTACVRMEGARVMVPAGDAGVWEEGGEGAGGRQKWPWPQEVRPPGVGQRGVKGHAGVGAGTGASSGAGSGGRGLGGIWKNPGWREGTLQVILRD